MKLLTDKEVAAQLRIKPRSVVTLDLPFVRVGSGKGVRRYRQKDVDAYVNLRVQDKGANNGNEKTKKAQWGRVSREPKTVGLPACSQGRSYARYVWETREEARTALIEFKKQLARKPEEPEVRRPPL